MAGEVTASNKPIAIPIEARAGKITSDDQHPLDKDDAQETLRELMRYRRQARVAQAENREQMAIDEDFYDGIQLQPEDVAALDDRGQDPLVFNLTKNTVNWTLGTERKFRIDFSVKPRRKADVQEAKTKTKAVKYVQDMNHGEYERSEAFADSVRAGLGIIEIGTRPGEEQIYYRAENWRYCWFDHLGGNNPDTWRFFLRAKWTDLDIAQAMFPDRAEALELLSSGVNSIYPYLPEDPIITDNASEFDIETDVDALLGGAYDGLRERVKLCEMWYRVPAQVSLLQLRDKETPYGTRHNVIYRNDDQEHQYLVKGGYATLYETVKMTTRVGIWGGATFLQDNLTPYDHDMFPFFPIFCYRRKRDGMPYGIIRDIRDPQSDLNKRRSKSLFMLSAHRVIIEKGAVDDPAKFRDEMDRPDGIAEVNAGALTGQRIHVVEEQALAVAHLELARDDAKFIQDIAGVTDENLGKKSNATSGKAIEARQLQGQTTSGIVFDNYFHSFQRQGECLVALIEQYWDQEKEFRITGDERQDEFISVNSKDEDGKPQNLMTRSKGDFIVSKQDFRESIRIAMMETLMTLITSLSTAGMGNVALALLDMVVEMMDELPGKDEMVARIRKINGQEGPDEGMSPQEKEKKQQEQMQKQKQQQEQQAIQQQMLALEMGGKQAKMELDKAKALDASVSAMSKKLDMFMIAMETALSVQVAPHAVAAADALIEDAQNLGDSQNQGQPQQDQQAQQQIPGGV